MAEFKITPTLTRKFFAQMRKAAFALGLDKEASDRYYREVTQACAHVDSIKLITTKTGYDSCLLRFSTDAGDFANALDYAIDRAKRYAYCIKVITLQIMQLQRLSPAAARSYFDSVVFRARRGAVWTSNAESFYLDLAESDLQLFLQILDTHLRKLKKRYLPLSQPGTFNDRILYYWDGPTVHTREVDQYYYANQPFTVRSS